MNKKWILGMALLGTVSVTAQSNRWQQRVAYDIDVKMNVQNNQFSGTEKIKYWNNSPDTLHKMFIFLYWNAFQPNSVMDVRSRLAGQILLGKDKKGNNVYDWDTRVKDRISKLKPDEIGFQNVHFVKINGIAQKLIPHETVLEVDLQKPILPNSETPLEISFNAHVPIQIRRSGRDNAEGVRYSMSQWYPKIAEYDYQGWNPNPYVGREFYGVYGKFNVNINIAKNYLLAGTGTIQNPDEVGFGYGKGDGKSLPDGTKTWKFAADNVHDFMWAADPDYKLLKRQPQNGPLLYIVYKKKDKAADIAWNLIADSVAYAYPFIAKTFGKYQYPNYSFVQGGDGGMEYPMATLIKKASLGTALHEWMHNWYQGVLGSNESLYPFMDEGGATYAETRISGWLHHDPMWYAPEYKGYFSLVASGLEEPMTTHADHYNTNEAYSQAAYSKGAVFYEQLSYIIGTQNMDRFLLEYEKEWRFKHPNPTDLIHIAEKVSGLELQWYKEYWVGTTKTIDYAIHDLAEVHDSAVVTLTRVGKMPMPVDLLVTYKDGSKEWHYIPTSLTFGNKPAENDLPRFVHAEWPWVNLDYAVTLNKPAAQVASVEIDPTERLADVDKSNNIAVYK